MASRRFLGFLLVLALAGCGGSGVAAEKWADKVCGAVGGWQVKVAALTKDAQTSMAGAKSPTEAQTSLVGLLGGAESASEKARLAVVAAGVPDVDKGDKLARQLTSAIASARDAYGKARKAVQGLSTADEKPFYDGVAGAMETLKVDYQPESADPTKLDSAELKKAFTTAASCQST